MSLAPGRQPPVVQLVEELRNPAVLGEDRARQRLRRVRGQHELHRHAVGRRRDLLLADAFLGQQRERLVERLAQRAAPALDRAPTPHAVVLLADVGEVEVHRERPQDDRLRLHVELRDGLGQGPRRSRVPLGGRGGRASGSAPRGGRRRCPPARPARGRGSRRGGARWRAGARRAPARPIGSRPPLCRIDGHSPAVAWRADAALCSPDGVGHASRPASRPGGARLRRHLAVARRRLARCSAR